MLLALQFAVAEPLGDLAAGGGVAGTFSTRSRGALERGRGKGEGEGGEETYSFAKSKTMKPCMLGGVLVQRSLSIGTGTGSKGKGEGKRGKGIGEVSPNPHPNNISEIRRPMCGSGAVILAYRTAHDEARKGLRLRQGELEGLSTSCS